MSIKISFFILYILAFLSINIHAQDLPNSIMNQDIQEEVQEDESGDFSVQEEQAKILKLELLTDTDSLQRDTLYVGQYVNISYSLMLFDNAKIVYTEFKPSIESSEDNGLSIAKEGEWEKDGDYYKISYTFKILSTKAVVPSLVVHVQNDYTQDSMQTDSIVLNAQRLSGNPNYCGVVANNLKVVDYTLESYDGKSNMILIELEGVNSNLEDFRLPKIKDQDFGQGAKFGIDTARVNVIARIPKSLRELAFEYFDMNKRDYMPVSVPNIIEQVDLQEDLRGDLNPRSSFFSISNIAVLVFLMFCIMLTLLKRSYFFAFVSCVLVGLLVYKIFANTYSIKTIANTKVLIQPTKNSTELFTIINPTKLEAVDKKNNFFKVNIDSKVGWISKDNTNKR